MKRIIIATLILMPLAQASAQDCNSAQTQSAMTQCAGEDFKKADHELNSVYQKIMKAVSGEQKKRFQSAQRKWIDYRDSDCEFQAYKSKGGSVNSMVHSTCLTDKTQQRVNDLKTMLNCPEGDVSCPL